MLIKHNAYGISLGDIEDAVVKHEYLSRGDAKKIRYSPPPLL
jgi:hypothetical protein